MIYNQRSRRRAVISTRRDGLGEVHPSNSSTRQEGRALAGSITATMLSRRRVPDLPTPVGSK